MSMTRAEPTLDTLTGCLDRLRWWTRGQLGGSLPAEGLLCGALLRAVHGRLGTIQSPRRSGEPWALPLSSCG